MVLCNRIVGRVLCGLATLGIAYPTQAQGILGTVFPEQRRMEIRDPAELPRVRLPDMPAPPTVWPPEQEREPLYLSLDDAIRVALENSEVVRVLTGAGSTSSGSTIYDPAITNTQIDQARGRFDPNVQVQNDFDRIDTPGAADFRQDESDPPDVRIVGEQLDKYTMGLGVSKTTVTGGTASLGVGVNSTARGSPLNPRASSAVDLSFSQPLLQGGGIRANLAPIEIARIDTERSFYQLKRSVQQLVRGVIEAYWALVFARVDVWAREQQAKQGEWDALRINAEFKLRRVNRGDVAQVESASESFQARLITAKANRLRREAALRSILGLPPSDSTELVPVTPPSSEWIEVEWETILRIAEQYRPDLIELKLLIESDQQQLLLAQNEAFPRVDASALYRWDALGGRDADGARVASAPGQFTGWQLGIDVSVPLGLRQSRAALRQRELLLMRDRANLEQALHNTTHLLAESYRNLAQYYQECQAFKKTRAAALINLTARSAWWERGLERIYLNVLQARTSWGDSVDSEAQSLLQYNTEFANLQEQMGTILETHGVRFVEESYCSIGPMGRLLAGRWYPRGRGPGPNEEQYESTSEPAEEAFDLEAPVIPRERDSGRRRLPAETPELEPGDLIQPLPDVELRVLPFAVEEPEQIPAPAPQQQQP